ncbi:hypothetical protein [Simplicispira psychrophila]|uniref:hypothetical protein n=1 Tax=Simplicispira psychrophila TaxID=80882 RepID=UPI000486591A|nr:hypothetical protein [Simplicispira psychrophila]
MTLQRLPQVPLLPRPLLTNAQWRCLRVLSEVGGDVAHAARKLHCAQGSLKGALAELQTCLGAQHLAVSDAHVQLSPSLQMLLRSRCD